MEKLIYYPTEVSQLLGIGLNKIYELLNQAEMKIPHVRVGRKYLIPKKELEKWLEERVGTDKCEEV